MTSKKIPGSGEIPKGKMEKKKSGAVRILEAVRDNAQLFQDQDGTPYAKVLVDNHHEVWPLESSRFRQWVSQWLYRTFKYVPNRSSISDALGVLSGIARFECKEKVTNIRTGGSGGRYYLDPCRKDWKIIIIEPGRWQADQPCPPDLEFRRTSSMDCLPDPERCGYKRLPGLLSKYLNVDEEGIRLVIAFLLECLRPDTENPVLETTGPPGSGKSSAQKRIRRCIDPNAVDLRAAANETKDLFVAARSNCIVSFENLTKLPKSHSDAFCILSTGGGFASRSLYTDAEETVYEVTRPVMLNGVGQLARSPDLIDRLIKIDTKPFEDGESKERSKHSVEFEADRGKILGSLLDLFSKVLVVLPGVKLAALPRMGDFAKLCEALTTVYGWNKSLVQTYHENRAASFADSLASSPTMVAVVEIVEEDGFFDGTYQELLDQTKKYQSNNEDRWVQSAKGLSTRIRESTPALKAVGVQVVSEEGRTNKGYVVHLRRVKSPGNIRLFPEKKEGFLEV